MKWRTAGVYMVIALGVMLAFGIGVSMAATKTVSWNAVTTYTDGTSIEGTKTVYYNIWMDSTLIGNKVTGTSLIFTVSDYGVTHQFTAQAELSTGEKSAVSPAYSWTSPLRVPATPAGLVVQ